MKVTKIALLAVAAVALTSSFLFLKQGGFGGGHGDFDKTLFILGLPWASIPWPGFVTKHDFVWLIALPFSLNASTVLMVTAVVGRARRHGRAAEPKPTA